MSHNEYLKLDNQLCFSLYACSRAISRMYRPLLDELGLTYPQYLVLLVLWEKEESTVKELSEILDLDSGTLTPMLKRMEAAGLVQRKRSSEDERVVIVRIADKGLALQHKAVCIPQALFASSGMTLEQLAELNRQVKAMMAHIHELNGTVAGE
ncbi:MarR family winged helix-turn-helix transcriptional regulator [Paenibacillus elgii]|uniref:MarR family transcriptional regulator n=1 Tax=Paenibacillus elgii TaxID=189691 RepID=A0A2T6FSJ0_9BACL|nr:MarR family transcriptional regulator [Paenibacillus elgii]NEN80712.1 MarR family transcriptional regulator [Paenibacillus elgii]PUA34868.1 MarR family transcriptional regulator [Paenibacillus elgii]